MAQTMEKKEEKTKNMTKMIQIVQCSLDRGRNCPTFLPPQSFYQETIWFMRVQGGEVQKDKLRFT